MSLRFSRVTLYSAGKTACFLVGGIPKSRTDLQGWTAYDNFVSGVPRYMAINARVETFLYGGEEMNASRATMMPFVQNRL